MAYANVRFGDVTLPENMVTDDLSSGQVESALLDSVGGVYDYCGATRRQPRRQTIAHSGQYVGETAYLVDELGNYVVDEAGNYIIAGTALQMLQSQIDALKGMVGVRASLWRRRDADDTEQWRSARLMSVAIALGQERVGPVATLDCQFEAGNDGWREETATAVAVTTVAGILKGFTVNNGGQNTAYDAVLTVACSSGTITQIAITGPGIELTWAGSLAAAATLTIDAAAQTVRVGTANSYSGLSRGGGHTGRGWLPIETGSGAWTVRTDGGAATVTLTFYEQFA